MQRLKDILTPKLYSCLQKLSYDKLQEIRLRSDKPLCVLYANKTYFVSRDGLTLDKNKSIVSTQNQVQEVLLNATQHSLHTFSHQLSNGFLAPFNGVRIGVCGTAVKNNGHIETLKDICSLNIRLPHEIKGCSKMFFKLLLEPLQNILILSPPAGGKTTFLRDLIYQTSFLNTPVNVLVADERGEIAGCVDGICQFDLGYFADVVSFADKHFTFSNGLRTMTPQIVACDEICQDDLLYLKNISQSGVKVFCTMHAYDKRDILESKNKNLYKQIFDRFMFLDAKNLGNVLGIYDKNFCQLEI